MSQDLKVTDYLKDIEEVAIPILQETLGLVFKGEPFSLILDTRTSWRGDAYVEISSGDLKYLLGDSLVHVMFKEIRLEGSSGDVFQDEKETLIPFRFRLAYNHPGGGSNGISFIPEHLYWKVEEKQWMVWNADLDSSSMLNLFYKSLNFCQLADRGSIIYY